MTRARPAVFCLGVCLCLAIPAQRSGIRLINVELNSGIQARMQCGSAEKRWIPEANGSGAAWLDYDNDGLMDLLIVNGSSMENLRKIVSGSATEPVDGGIYLYRNLGNGRFQDKTKEAGLSSAYWGTGANAADFDNDGNTDILVTTIGIDLLYRNNGNGTFTEIGKKAGLSRTVAWHTGSAFGDYDNDGFLDLFVAGYVDIKELLNDNPEPPTCNYLAIPGFCGPRGLKGERDILYHNNGDGTFTEVTAAAGVSDSALFHGFTAVFDDFNGDGKIDLFVANDSDPNYLYLNQGDGTFKESALLSGLALNGDGQAQANMGVAIGDFDGDGLLDVLTTTFSEDYFPLFKQVKPGQFEDVSAKLGLAAATSKWVGWACGFADFNNDGVRELWIANGHVYPTIGRMASSSYLQPVVVFENRSGRMVLNPGAVSDVPANSYRGGCAADFDNDGRMDLVVLPIAGSPILLANKTEARGSWIGLRLRGTISNRDAIGARVRLQSCGVSQVETVRSGGSYLSANDPRIHFGLGTCEQVSRLTIDWPSGIVQSVVDLPVNKYLTIEEPRRARH